MELASQNLRGTQINQINNWTIKQIKQPILKHETNFNYVEIQVQLNLWNFNKKILDSPNVVFSGIYHPTPPLSRRQTSCQQDHMGLKIQQFGSYCGSSAMIGLKACKMEVLLEEAFLWIIRFMFVYCIYIYVCVSYLTMILPRSWWWSWFVDALMFVCI